MKKNKVAQSSALQRTGDKKSKNQSKRNKIWLFILAFIIVAIISSFVFRKEIMMFGFDHVVAPTVERSLKNSYVRLNDDNDEVTEASTKLDKSPPFSLLLLGTDQRENENGLSDSIIYTVIRPKDNKVLFVSIPRDSYTKIIGAENVKGARRNTKINASHSYGGAQMSVDTVENLLDAPINYYATINFNGLVEVVDALGGVELPITKLIENKNPAHEKLRVEPNKPIYLGKEALMYVRYREDSDFKRTERQRIFLKAALERMKNISNIANIKEIMGLAGDNFKTNMKADFMLALAKRVIFESGTPQIISHMLQGTDKRTDQWYYILDEEDVQNTHELIELWLAPDTTASELGDNTLQNN
ncbi:LCP family protein [Paenibacillus wynnii]|uniref:LCP family protein n=1 Tax=Paenibacillus wynnii TaxID=268407 RepID=UPI00278F2635|nr:LCP family protein [Paenibacillus wynnii]MDQ0195357.1 LCP family protein required for cell wall assembly [Paenibacillus wynnii]